MSNAVKREGREVLKDGCKEIVGNEIHEEGRKRVKQVGLVEGRNCDELSWWLSGHQLKNVQDVQDSL